MLVPTQRINKALAWMEERDLGGLVMFSDGTLSILRPSYLQYWAGYRPFKAFNAAVLDREGRSVLLVQPAWDISRVAQQSWIQDVRGSKDIGGDLVSVFQELGIRGKIGIAGHRDLTWELYSAISSHGPVVPAEDLIESLAVEKTEAEIENARKAGRIADTGFYAFVSNSRPGIREYELAAEVEYAMRMAGADDNFILMSSDTHNFEMHEPSDRRLRPGDIVIGEITPVVEGQFLQVCRTVVVGQPTGLVRGKYDLLLRAFHAALDEVKPGAAAGRISKAMNQVLKDAGYGEYCYPPHMRARGHGFGVGSIAPGGVVDDNTEAPLMAGQVVVVHPNQYLPETGYLACGETVLVTDTGYERLSESETNLYAWEA